MPLLAPLSASEEDVEVGATDWREALAKVARLEEAATAVVIACATEDAMLEDGAEMAVIDEDFGVLTDVERVELVVGTTTLEVVGIVLVVVGATYTELLVVGGVDVSACCDVCCCALLDGE